MGASTSERVFRRLLAIFPGDFRRQFGHDMAELFRDQHRAARERGGTGGVASLWLHTLPRLGWAAALEHRDALRRDIPHRRQGMLATLRGDLRFAERMLRKSPAFTLVAVLCIALGSGAVTTIFSTMNALVLRPIPGVGEPARVVRVERTFDGAEGQISLTNAYFEHLRRTARSLDGVAAWSKVSLTVRGEGRSGATVYGNFVSGNFFAVLGVRPLLGRFFLEEEDRTESTHPVIVVSEPFWRTHLGADSGAVGRAITVNGNRFTLIGVTSPDFHGVDVPIEASAWVPLRTRRMLSPSGGALDSPHVQILNLAARMRDGATPTSAHEELQALTTAWLPASNEQEWMRRYTDVRLSAMAALPSDARRTLAGFLGLLLGAAALVLLIASVNVAALLSARAIARRREMAVRAALGAARSRLVTQLLTEILALFALGALGGAALSVAATSALERLPIPGDVPFRLELSPDPRVFGFTLLVSLLTGIVVGLAPARRAAGMDVVSQLRNGTAGSGSRRTLLGSSLVVGQLALSLVLLVGAGLFVRALQHGGRIDPGFDASGVVTATMNAETWGYDQQRARTFSRALGDRIAALPGVTAVSYASGIPLTLHSSGDNIQVGPAVGDAEGNLPVQFLKVDAGYFDVLRIPILGGRPIVRQDEQKSPPVAVVNQTLARRLQPDGNVVGRTFGLYGKEVTIVGIARDAKQVSLGDAVQPLAYFPVTQHWETRQMLLVRTSHDPRTLGPAIQAAVRAIDEDVPPPAVTTLEEAMGIGILPQRVAAMVTGVLGVVGLLLATVGLYGVIAYSASRRTREIGIRLALGARGGDVLRLIVREGVRLTATGVAIGLVLAAGVTRLMRGLLFGVSPLDGATYAVMSVMFVAVAMLATWLPARLAARANPMVVLRGE